MLRNIHPPLAPVTNSPAEARMSHRHSQPIRTADSDMRGWEEQCGWLDGANYYF